MNATNSNNSELVVAKSVNKSNLMKAAWALVKKTKGMNISEALRIAWKALKLRLEMTKHAVKFQFRKANGEIRDAIGILSNIPYESKGSNKKPCYTCIAYWDLGKNAFRSFTIDSLI